MNANLSFENRQVLNLIQALLGRISSNFRVIGLSLIGASVSLYFIIQQEDLADRSDIEDIVFEFEALQVEGVDVDVWVFVDDRPLADLEMPKRVVFIRKE